MTICDMINHAGLSFEELCKTTGIPTSTLSDILSGKAELTHCQARTIQKLSHGIGLSMDELMELDSLARSVPEKNESCCIRTISIIPKPMRLSTGIFLQPVVVRSLSERASSGMPATISSRFHVKSKATKKSPRRSARRSSILMTN